MRTLIGLGLVLALTCGATAADDKIDAKKILGKWEPKEPKKGEALMMEFAKDGKLIVTGETGGKDVKIEGTYKLDGDQLTYAVTFMGVDAKETVTITKLTDDEMEGKDKDGKVEAFKKVKSK